MASYALNEEKMFSDIADGVAIVINSETGIYYGMNNFGTNVFDNIIKGIDTSDILAVLTKDCADSVNMKNEFESFIEKLKKFEIIVDGSGSNENFTFDKNAADADNYKLVVQEYSDAQELLLADPIHEVKNETGWEPDKSALENSDKAKEKLSKAK